MLKKIKQLCLISFICFSPVFPLGLSSAWAFSDCPEPLAFSPGEQTTKQKAQLKSGKIQAFSNCNSTPTEPTNISYPATSNSGSFTVFWDPSTSSVSEYRLEEQKNSGAWVQVYVGSTSVKNLTGRSDGSYRYRVKACNGAICSGFNTGTTTLTVGNTPTIPASPASINATSTSYTVS
ncbi:fibronectin type III domain-containing protein [Pleionea sp. CnH1-48]|uniref:fibronectin type III domain-containing protein n=1 Tax=Pleionea sp. CnH1-48 TaxID=2954494 RepID=UPI002098149B|nr:fibronectin type III domain-containing protein [Pleionea sp. CnH1-48]MCO7225948.1 fibronectin type III domain-containing protein [Pleionea sp. CnH1-48]